MTNVDVTNPEVQKKLTAAGVQWSIKHMDTGLDIPAAQAKELGVTDAMLKKEEAQHEKAEEKAAKAQAKADKLAADKLEEAKAKTDAEAEKKVTAEREAAKKLADEANRRR